MKRKLNQTFEESIIILPQQLYFSIWLTAYNKANSNQKTGSGINSSFKVPSIQFGYSKGIKCPANFILTLLILNTFNKENSVKAINHLDHVTKLKINTFLWDEFCL